MSFLKRFKPAKFRPLLNIGCLFDIPTGSYKKGIHGESILNGGVAPITGIAGRANTYKSTLGHFKTLRILDRHPSALGVIYDTEESLSDERIFSLAKDMPHIGGVDLIEEQRLSFTNKTAMSGTVWFNEFRKEMQERGNSEKNFQLTTPFIKKDGEVVQSFPPLIGEIDSFSQMDLEALDKLYMENDVGASSMNMEAMKMGAAKSQMMMQFPGVVNKGGGYLILTAHVGDEHQIDPYSPPSKKLSFLKNKTKLKRVPENFTFLTNNLWFCISAAPLINDTKKTPEFPRNSEDDLKGDTDLMLVTLQNLRGKSGPTGIPFDLVVSQSDGIHPGLSEFWYLKKNKEQSSDVGYGIGGHTRSYYLELMPDIKMSRTTVRGTIDENDSVKRTFEITSELCQMKNLWHSKVDHDIFEPKDLYEKIKELGYDWDLLLSKTRGYWMFKEDIKTTNLYFLSTMDILNMANGLYHPWWYDEAVKKAKG